MATHPCILAWRIPMEQRCLVGFSPWDCKESDTTEQLSAHTHKLEEVTNVRSPVLNVVGSAWGNVGLQS